MKRKIKTTASSNPVRSIKEFHPGMCSVMAILLVVVGASWTACAHDLIVDTDARGTAATVSITTASDFSDGVLIRGAKHAGGGVPSLTVESAGTLGANSANNVVEVQGGALRLTSPGNIGALQPLTVDSTGHSRAILSLGTGFTTVPSLSSRSSAILALNGGTRDLGIDDQSALGSGRWFIGANITDATFNPAALAPGLDNRYRFGGGNKMLTLGVVLADQDGTGLEVGSLHTTSRNSVIRTELIHGFTGPAMINRGELRLHGASGSALNCPVWYVNKTAGDVGLNIGVNNQNTLDDGETTFGRIGNTAQIVLNRGRILLTGRGGHLTEAERFGVLRLEGGDNIVRVNSPANGSSMFVASALERSAWLPSLFFHTDANAPSYFKVDQVETVPIVGGNGSRSTNKPIVPFAVTLVPFPHAEAYAATFATYDAGDGFRWLHLTDDYVASIAGADPDGDDNVRHVYSDDVTVTLDADMTINALMAWGTADNKTLTIAGEGRKLTVQSGAILLASGSGASNRARLTITATTLDFGEATGVMRAISHQGNGITLSSALVGTNGLMVVTGGAPVVLSGQNDGLSGPIVINNGRLEIGSLASLPSSGIVRLSSGIERDEPWSTLRSNVGVQSGVAVACAAVYGSGVLELFNVSSALNIGAPTGGANGYVTLAAGGILAPGDVAIDPGNPELRVGTLLIRNEGNNSSSHAVLALNDGELRIDLAAPDAHDMIVFETRHADAQAHLSFGDPGSTLVVNLGFLPELDDTFKIIDVLGTTASSGSFANGEAVVATFGENKVLFDILYNSDLAGGDGNDVVLRTADIRTVRSGTIITLR